MSSSWKKQDREGLGWFGPHPVRIESEAYDLLVRAQLTYITLPPLMQTLQTVQKFTFSKKNQQRCCYQPRWAAVSLSDSVELREGNFLESILWIFAHKKKQENKQEKHRREAEKTADLLWRRRQPPRPGNGSSLPSFSGKTPSTRHCWLLQSGICLTGPAKRRRGSKVVKWISLSGLLTNTSLQMSLSSFSTFSRYSLA